ncbi:MAG: hypothetical protein KAG99_04710 [Bacteroidales bacterium]|nr:hypothetical protein [Bacteroidales bacterium]
MKNMRGIFILLFVLTLHSCLAQNNENPLSQTERLAITGKVWGIIKYYNPTVGKGKIDWDSVLIVTLKKIKNVTTDQEFYEIINKLIIPTEFGKMNKINTDSLKLFLSNNDIDLIENREKLPDSINLVSLLSSRFSLFKFNIIKTNSKCTLHRNKMSGLGRNMQPFQDITKLCAVRCYTSQAISTIAYVAVEQKELSKC